MHTLLPLIIFTFKSHYVRISCLTIRKKIPPQQDIAILQANGIDHCTITALRPQDTSVAQRRLQSMRARDAHSNVSRDAPQDMISQH